MLTHQTSTAKIGIYTVNYRIQCYIRILLGHDVFSVVLVIAEKLPKTLLQPCTSLELRTMATGIIFFTS